MVELTILIVSVLTSLCIGVFVYARNPRSIVNRLYGLLTLSFILFPTANYFSLHTTDRLPYIRAVIFVSTVAVAALYYLVVFMGKRAGNSKLSAPQLWGVYYTLFVMLLAWTPLVFKGLTGGPNPTPVPNFGAIFFLMQLVLFPAASVAVLVRRLRHAKGIQRLQSFYLLLGIAPIVLFAPLTSFVMPIILKNTSLIILSPVYALIFVGLTGYAIVRHKLFDIRYVVLRATVYTFSTLILGMLYALPAVVLLSLFMGVSLTARNILVGVAILTFTGVIFRQTKRWFDDMTAHLFFRSYYDTQEVLRKLSKMLAETISLTRIISETKHIFSSILQTSVVEYVFVSKGDERVLVALKTLFGKSTPKVIFLDELEVVSEAVEVLRDMNIATVVKLRTTHEDLGFMMLGYKESGEIYNEYDRKLLNIAADEIALSMQNALHFEEIQQFNVTLQGKINEATRKLRATNTKLEALDETKDDFISMASHQLRTPLTSVKGYLSMVIEGDAGSINDTQRKMLNQAFISSQRMVYLIADLLNVSRLKTGKFIIDWAPVDLSKVIQEELSQLVETAQSRDITLTYKKPTTFPVLNMDETKTRQVIMNFVDNAIYYTPAGGKIDVQLLDKNSSIELRVVDTGIGVPKAEQHHLFTKFYRARNAQKARPDGTGLGLFMAKKVIIAQGGALIFESKEGHGSTFGFSFSKAHLNPANTLHSAPAVAEAATSSLKA
jgi:signal transduction histidine kinase